MLTYITASLAAISFASIAPEPISTHANKPISRASETALIGADFRTDSPSFEVISDHEIIADGHAFQSWEELHAAGYFNFRENKCGTIPNVVQADQHFRGGNDCGYNNTNTLPTYDPSVGTYRIPVVVHVIQRTNGTGAMSDERVQSQIDILNEDFQAMVGTNGEGGTNSQIEFYLATQDPDGNPTNGITRSTNNTWFNDGGRYYNTLAWDTSRYLNIYSNNGGGALGYVPDLAQGITPGSSNKGDRVVVLYSTFGRNAPFAPYNLGRTVTHEVGHYLGLYHTFDFGCDNGSCNRSGDRICDTNPVGSPSGGCPTGRNSCGQLVPIHNYMDYSDDRCMNQFTPDQSNRMRCSLINYRPNLYQIATTGPCSQVDLAEPFGELDFFDASEFLELFSQSALTADLTDDSVFDFFDVAEFLEIYAAGCP